MDSMTEAIKTAKIFYESLVLGFHLMVAILCFLAQPFIIFFSYYWVFPTYICLLLASLNFIIASLIKIFMSTGTQLSIKIGIIVYEIIVSLLLGVIIYIATMETDNSALVPYGFRFLKWVILFPYLSFSILFYFIQKVAYIYFVCHPVRSPTVDIQELENRTFESENPPSYNSLHIGLPSYTHAVNRNPTFVG